MTCVRGGVCEDGVCEDVECDDIGRHVEGVRSCEYSETSVNGHP